MIRKWIDRIKGMTEEPAEVPAEGAEEQSTEPEGAEPNHHEAARPSGGAEGLFQRLKRQMARSREGFVRRLDALLQGGNLDDTLLEEIEELLVTADMGVPTVEELIQDLRKGIRAHRLQEPAELRKEIQNRILQLLSVDRPPIAWDPSPFVVLMVGVNGVGKTTTIAKLAHSLKQEGRSVLLVAADTFRAAAAAQLEQWATRLKLPLVRRHEGADPSAVAYDGVEEALKRKVDVVIVDTAGRLHTKVNLMGELKKIKRVLGKKIQGAPHEILLVLDATTGQNALSQARLFHEAVGVTGIVLTKLDGTAKGGIVVSIAHQLGIPIRYIGIGERMEDLQPFQPEAFVEALFQTQD